MPLYELLVIARSQSVEINRKIHKTLLKASATMILENNGVVRELKNLGTGTLPYRMKRHQEIFDTGRYDRLIQLLYHKVRLLAPCDDKAPKIPKTQRKCD
jgi:ribosomal protein S6